MFIDFVLGSVDGWTDGWMAGGIIVVSVCQLSHGSKT